MNEEISLEESTKKNKHKYQNTKDKVWKNVELIKHKMQEERINMKLYEEISGLIRNEPSQTLTQEMSSRRMKDPRKLEDNKQERKCEKVNMKSHKDREK